MTKAKIRKLLGKRAMVCWRDPQTEAAWTSKPLKTITAPAESLGWLVGFNPRGELVLAADRNCSGTSDGEYGATTAIPTSLIESIEVWKVT